MEQKKSFLLSDLNSDVTDYEVTLVSIVLDKILDCSGYSKKEDVPEYKSLGKEALDDSIVFYQSDLKSEKERRFTSYDRFIESGEKLGLVEEVCEKYEVKVNFITNRKLTKDRRKYFTGDRGSEVFYGVAGVRIPESHKSGVVERPSILKFSIKEDVNKRIVIRSMSMSEEDEFYESIKKESEQDNQAILFVHGYNVPFKDSVYKAAQLKFDLHFTGPMILFSWPSKGSVFKYTHDVTSSESSSGLLKDVIVNLIDLGIDEVFFVAHSMGARCLSMALQSYAHENQGVASLDGVVLAAPDVDKEHFVDNIANTIMPIIKSGIIYLSDTDVALMASKVMNGYPILGDVSEIIPVFNSVDTVDVSGAGSWFLKHSYVSEDDRVLDDLYHFLFNKQPPNKRRLKKEENSLSKTYWKF